MAWLLTHRGATKQPNLCLLIHIDHDSLGGEAISQFMNTQKRKSKWKLVPMDAQSQFFLLKIPVAVSPRFLFTAHGRPGIGSHHRQGVNLETAPLRSSSEPRGLKIQTSTSEEPGLRKHRLHFAANHTDFWNPALNLCSFTLRMCAESDRNKPSSGNRSLSASLCTAKMMKFVWSSTSAPEPKRSPRSSHLVPFPSFPSFPFFCLVISPCNKLYWGGIGWIEEILHLTSFPN